MLAPLAIATLVAPDFFLLGVGVGVVVVAFVVVALVASARRPPCSVAVTVGVKVMATTAAVAMASVRNCMVSGVVGRGGSLGLLKGVEVDDRKQIAK
jgi:hypothetical protein